MKSLIVHIITMLLAVTALVLTVDGCEHRNDYKVAANDLTIIGFNLMGDVKAVTSKEDTVFVYGKYQSFLYKADTTWQTKFIYLEPVGFTTDSVVVRPY